jgi:hypothetical protein
MSRMDCPKCHAVLPPPNAGGQQPCPFRDLNKTTKPPNTTSAIAKPIGSAASSSSVQAGHSWLQHFSGTEPATTDGTDL